MLKEHLEDVELDEDSKEGLKKKAEKSGMPYGILKKVYDRGMAALSDWMGTFHIIERGGGVMAVQLDADNYIAVQTTGPIRYDVDQTLMVLGPVREEDADRLTNQVMQSVERNAIAQRNQDAAEVDDLQRRLDALRGDDDSGSKGQDDGGDSTEDAERRLQEMMSDAGVGIPTKQRVLMVRRKIQEGRKLRWNASVLRNVDVTPEGDKVFGSISPTVLRAMGVRLLVDPTNSGFVFGARGRAFTKVLQRAAASSPFWSASGTWRRSSSR